MTKQPKLCSKGLHEMTPENTRVRPADGAKQCRSCAGIARRDRNRVQRATDPEWYAKQKEYTRQWIANNKKHVLSRQLAWRQANRKLMFDHLGWLCACCGETEPVFLTVDHIDGGGNEWRRANGGRNRGGAGVDTIVAYFRKTGEWPDGLQTLCFNCNTGKHINGGVCPHQIPDE